MSVYHYTFILSVALIIIGNDPVQSTHLAGCGDKWEHTILACHCDDLCEFYQDCCHGYVHNYLNISLRKVSEDLARYLNCERLAGLEHKASFVTSSPVKRARHGNILRQCHNPLDTDAFEALPVYDATLKVNFRNLFCRQLHLFELNLDTSVKNAILWSIEITSTCFEQIIVTLKDNIYMDFLYKVFSQNNCRFNFVPPENANIRLCFDQIPDGCTDTTLCDSYQNPIMNTAGNVFKNKHCAVCFKQQSNAEMAHRPIAKGAMDYKNTYLTITKIDSLPKSWQDIYVTKRGCHHNCSRDMMLHDGKCILPVSKVRGFVHQMSFNLASNETLEVKSDSQKLRKRISMWIGHEESLDVKTTVKTLAGYWTTARCVHVITISLYLKHSVEYELFLTLNSHIKEIVDNTTNAITMEIMEPFFQSNVTCDVKGHTGSSIYKNPNTDGTVKLIIFGSVLGGYMVIVVAVTLVKRLITILARSSRTGVDGACADGAGVDGPGVDGACVDGTGVDGAGVDGAGVDGACADGAGVDGACADGACVDGAGVDGACVDGAGVDGAGVDGACVDGAGVDGVGVDGPGVDGPDVEGAGVDGPGADAD